MGHDEMDVGGAGFMVGESNYDEGTVTLRCCGRSKSTEGKKTYKFQSEIYQKFTLNARHDRINQ